MAKKRSRNRSYFPTKIPVNTLSGGVGTQSPDKRLPTESEEMVNMFCTTERSIDKRSGLRIVPFDNSEVELPIDASAEMWWYWFIAGNEQQFLIGIDVDATTISNFLRVYKVNSITNEITPQLTDGNIPESVRNYLKHGLSSRKKALSACSVGSSILVLNSDVKAGFTSDGVDPYTFDFNGEKTDIEDPLGQKIVYRTSVSVDPGNEAEVWLSSADYVWGQKVIDTSDSRADFDSTQETSGILDGSRYGIWQIKSSVIPEDLPGPTSTNGLQEAPSTTAGADDWERVVADSSYPTDDARRYEWSDFIPVEDYVYPDATKLYLGQSVARFSDLKFPPDLSDHLALNFNDDQARVYGDSYSVSETLKALYDTPNDSTQNGQGKIFYLSEAYLASTPGYYRVVNFNTEQNRYDKPYLQKIRTPDEMSVIDKKRMPMQIYLDSEKGHWSIREVEWDPRTSGTKNSNPGPSLFRNPDKTAKQTTITAMAYYRDRLFLATEDTLISSKLGDFSNLFLGDPSNITFSDPIDLKVSSNVYTPITFLKPFKDFLFLGTSGDTQYELMGSENQVSPLTAEIAPTTFFPMTEDVEPLVMNNNLFFFSKKRLYIYFQRQEASGQQAFELSRHVPDYIAESFWDTAVSAAHNTIFALEGDGPSGTVLCYRNQVAGDRVIQNAFFRFDLGIAAHSIHTIEDYLYVVVTGKKFSGQSTYRIMRMNLRPDDTSIPRLDRLMRVTISNPTYDAETDETSCRISECDGGSNEIVLSSGTVYKNITFDPDNIGEDYGTVKIPGIVTETGTGWCGKVFKSSVKLSKLFLRTQENNIVPGTLNLRYGIARHRNTGQYDILVTRKERTSDTYKHEPKTIGDRSNEFDGVVVEQDGIFKFPLMGFSNDIDIEIESSYHTPLNITNIEITGKFKRVPHFLTS